MEFMQGHSQGKKEIPPPIPPFSICYFFNFPLISPSPKTPQLATSVGLGAIACLQPSRVEKESGDKDATITHTYLVISVYIAHKCHFSITIYLSHFPPLLNHNSDEIGCMTLFFPMK